MVLQARRAELKGNAGTTGADPERRPAHRNGQLSDVSSDPVLDRIVALACTLCSTDGALIAFADTGRLRVKAATGTAVREIPIGSVDTADLSRSPSPTDAEATGQGLRQREAAPGALGRLIRRAVAEDAIVEPVRSEQGTKIGVLAVFSCHDTSGSRGRFLPDLAALVAKEAER